MQPKSREIIQALPPTREAMADAFVVLFTTSREDVKKAKMLEVPREEYMQCARLRAKVCPAFADTTLSEEAALESLPAAGVPDAFVDAALHLEEAKHFEPNFVGPATMKAPDAAEPSEVEAQAETSSPGDDSADASCGNHASVTADDSVAENLIGLDEGPLCSLFCFGADIRCSIRKRSSCNRRKPSRKQQKATANCNCKRRLKDNENTVSRWRWT